MENYSLSYLRFMWGVVCAHAIKIGRDDNFSEFYCDFMVIFEGFIFIFGIIFLFNCPSFSTHRWT